MPIGDCKDHEDDRQRQQDEAVEYVPEHALIHDTKQDLRRSVRGVLAVCLVQPLAHFLAGLEERNALLINRDMFAGTWVAARSRGTVFHGKRAKSAQFHPVAARKRGYDLIQDRVDNILNVSL